MSNDKEIRELFAKHGAQLAREDVWDIQGSYIIRHRALERLAASIGIQFEKPHILRAEKDEAVILATGVNSKGVSEWSIGEAFVNVNYRVSGKQAAYVYAMAEKRAKDRVIIKLAGLHGVYSEDEADDFKQPPQVVVGVTNINREAFDVDTSQTTRDTILFAIDLCSDIEQLQKLWAEQKDNIRKLHAADKEAVESVKEDRKQALKGKEREKSVA